MIEIIFPAILVGITALIYGFAFLYKGEEYSKTMKWVEDEQQRRH